MLYHFHNLEVDQQKTYFGENMTSSLLYRSTPTQNFMAQIFLGYQELNIEIYLDDGGRIYFLNVSF
jgi:hypothetical protein